MTRTEGAAITGIGVVAPGGPDTRGFWELLTSGASATRTITSFDPSPFRSQVAAECDFDAASRLSHEDAARLDRASQFALACTAEALADAGLPDEGFDPERTAVSIGSAVGCTTSLEREYLEVSDRGRLWEVDHTRAVPHLYDFHVPSTFARDVAWHAGAEGPAAVVSTGCTSGLDAVAHGLTLIREGSADVVIAGATDAPISPITVACFDAIRATTPSNDDPEHASRPFDRNRNGFVLAEGAAILVLERPDRAARRGARAYATITGAANRCNAYHMTGLRPDGREMAAAIDSALAQAGLSPDDIDYVNAHGSGTKQNDRHETAAFKRSLGPHAYEVPVSSIKSMVGHSLGAIGSIELAACALAIRDGVVPPTANLTAADPECDLDYVPAQAREAGLDAVLSVGSGFGGFQTAVVLTGPEGARQ